MNSITKICTVKGCDNRGTSRGYCGKHYWKFRQYGDPCAYRLKSYNSLLQKLIDKTRFPDDLNDCWIWAGVGDALGYGVIPWRGRTHPAHRAMYEQLIEHNIDGLVIDHLCRTPSCVNPLHLEAVSNRVNILRGFAPAALNKRKRACINGHPFNKTNTYFRTDASHPHGYRRCRACRTSPRKKQMQL